MRAVPECIPFPACAQMGHSAEDSGRYNKCAVSLDVASQKLAIKN